MPTTPTTRLVRAVAAERAELSRHRARLAEEAEALRLALARIEHGLGEIDERRELLDRLAPSPSSGPVDPAPAEPGDGALRGPAIREVAVRVLAARGGGGLHYREWFALLEADGRTIAGKDPLAVFLTQLTRSPAVRRGAGAGVYELDPHAERRLRTALHALHRELRELTPATGMRGRRARLTAEIDRTERALEEVARVLAPA